MKRDAVVIGAGLIGTTTAWFLAERGFDVTVIDRREAAGLETSFANGGLLTPSEADPWNAPGTLWRMLRWLGHEDSPLLVRPRALPGMLRWGIAFLRASHSKPHRCSTERILRLALYSLRSMDELERRLPFQYDRLSNGSIKIFRDRKAFEAAVELAETLRSHGLKSRRLRPDAAAALEPSLVAVSDRLVGAIHYPDDGSGDAYLFTQALQQHAIAAGVKFQFNTTVTALQATGDHIQGVTTEHGELRARCYVLAAGSYSSKLGGLLKMRLPIYPVKGYSATIQPAIAHSLRTPIVDFEQKIVITPLGKRIRIAGTAEFNGYDASPNSDRGESMLRQAIAILPTLADAIEYGSVTHWTGLRPMTCDGPPILGVSPYKNLFFNTGHGPLGWTLCAGSARLVADRIAGLNPEIDITDYSFDRFRH